MTICIWATMHVPHTVHVRSKWCTNLPWKLSPDLVILACNTASAKALRSIQQNDLPYLDDSRRVLGVIRPTAESIGEITKSRHVGILATSGTIHSESYPMEIKKLFPDITVNGVACPMWVPLVENKEYDSEGADFFVKKYINELLDNYPLLIDKIRQFTPEGINIITQGEYVATSLKDYLRRHDEIASRCTKNGKCEFLTTESVEKFKESASIFLHEDVEVRSITLE